MELSALKIGDAVNITADSHALIIPSINTTLSYVLFDLNDAEEALYQAQKKIKEHNAEKPDILIKPLDAIEKSIESYIKYAKALQQKATKLANR